MFCSSTLKNKVVVLNICEPKVAKIAAETTVFHRLKAARLVFRIKAAAASISNKSRAACIWVFHFHFSRKKTR